MTRGTTHAPKSEATRHRHARPAHGEKVIVRDNRTRGPRLEGEWSSETQTWYETWRKSPQSQLFEATDWQRLRLLAPLVEANFIKPSAAGLSEIRLNEERLGATVVDRMRARIAITERDPGASNAPAKKKAPRADI
ncbi:hypothetical protein C5E10_05330 [Pseudoclavibacter sp. RFBG4]|uniref:phage terminase small subunit n=1 Tax=Pseudoclavibacter sp. RFBG4 TaxID=2080575 RepID=UPI000CE881DE|nr:hypothetical protein [Pseudoclavibacter sp. RFBG4]PPG35025.1 hypothetical protein C5E10_05330 [Pseudoclavibacter sp. RFBG4]